MTLSREHFALGRKFLDGERRLCFCLFGPHSRPQQRRPELSEIVHRLHYTHMHVKGIDLSPNRVRCTCFQGEMHLTGGARRGRFRL